MNLTPFLETDMKYAINGVFLVCYETQTLLGLGVSQCPTKTRLTTVTHMITCYKLFCYKARTILRLGVLISNKDTFDDTDTYDYML
jgi:hypothetical protein